MCSSKVQDLNSKIYLYGMQPSLIHIGHMGIVQYVKELAGEKVFMIADLHREFNSNIYDKDTLTEETLRFLDPHKYDVVIQSNSSEHSQLFFYLLKFVDYSLLNKISNLNSSYVSKSDLTKLLYPVLMCADVILYSPCTVIVGSDQLHNVRLIKEILRRIKLERNMDICVDFEIVSNRIMNTKGDEKMSSSDSSSTIFLNSSPSEIRKKVFSVVTSNIYPIDEQAYKQMKELNIFRICNVLNIKLENIISCKSYNRLKEEIFKQLVEYKNILSSHTYEEMKNRAQLNSSTLRQRINDNYRKFI